MPYWFKKIAQTFTDTSYWGRKFINQNPQFQGQLDVYQSQDFPHVFLGGQDELDDVIAKTNQEVCAIIDCRDLPEISPDDLYWDYDKYNQVKQQFDRKVQQVIAQIQGNQCPVYVHCAAGINRSVAVLAAALSSLTGKNVDSLLAEMKKSRMIINPQDPYYLMATEASPHATSTQKRRTMQEIDVQNKPEADVHQTLSPWLQRALTPQEENTLQPNFA